ncbi:hypothetical protein RUM44_003960 [Polyplax serrata]|uniref:Peptidase metallopeptidase domain-containing protein n=1 Tax=Polyplax serrata TaxID=468196 RepID=A0ABR1B1W3_POLSC
MSSLILRSRLRQCLFQISMVLVFFLGNCEAESTDITKAVIYLSRFGYLPPNIRSDHSASLISAKQFSDGLADFQSFFGLNVTGALDDETLKMMKARRCGVPDKIYGTNSRYKRYNFLGTQWTKYDLTYKIAQYSRSFALTKAEMDIFVRQSFKNWSKFCSLTFMRSSKSETDFNIAWYNGSHDCEEAFDGPGGILAHAYDPEIGEVHFDDEEPWSTLCCSDEPHFEQTATHEFGHALGLAHTTVMDAIMAPIYHEDREDMTLHDDDIKGIQVVNLFDGSLTALYGPKGSPKPPPSTMSSDNKPVCFLRLKLDAAFTNRKNKIFLFSGKHVYQLNSKGIVSGYPKKISEVWKGAPADIDAAINFNGGDYFFKGQKYWVFYKGKKSMRSPQYINKGFKGIPDNLDAAMEYKKIVYFFKGSKCWVYDPKFKFLKGKSLPKDTAKGGLPQKIEAALSYNGKYYLFYSDKYWRLLFWNFQVDKDRNPFPRSTRDWWFHCGKKKKGKIKKL